MRKTQSCCPSIPLQSAAIGFHLGSSCSLLEHQAFHKFPCACGAWHAKLLGVFLAHRPAQLDMHVCVYIYMYACMYTHTFIHIHIYMFYICIYAYAHAYLYILIYGICIYMYIYINIIYVYLHVHTCTVVYIYIYMHRCVCICLIMVCNSTLSIRYDIHMPWGRYQRQPGDQSIIANMQTRELGTVGSA